MQVEKRLSLAEAQKAILNSFPLDHPMSINEFRKTKMKNANWQTVWKAISLINDTQKHLLENNIVLDLKKDGNRYLITTRQINLLSLPVEKRVRYIRQKYFPQPELEDILLIELYHRNAVKKENAIRLKEDKITKKLLAEEKINKIEERTYLTKDGVMVAKGLIKLYPEIK